jgi:hypothetical protein
MLSIRSYVLMLTTISSRGASGKLSPPILISSEVGSALWRLPLSLIKLGDTGFEQLANVAIPNSYAGLGG